MDINKKEVGARIKFIRISLGLTMEEFGEKVGKALKSNVSKWERGDSLPNNARLKRIAELGNVSMTYLLEGKYMIKDIHMMSQEEQEKLAQYRGAVITEDPESDYFLQMAKKFSACVDDKLIKTELASLLNGLVEINEGSIPKEQLQNELDSISTELSKIPFKLINKN